jgi:hypothetical protein
MKTSTAVRVALAAAIVTFGCLGLLFHIPGAMACFLPALFLIIERAEITKPIPGNERLQTFIAIFLFIAIVLVVSLLPSHATKETLDQIISHPVFVFLWWLYWLWRIYRFWQRQNRPSES